MIAYTYRTMIGAVKGLQARWFTANLMLIDALFHPVSSRRTFRPDKLAIVEHHRVDRHSSPDDLSVCYGLQTRDRAHGLLVDASRTYANLAVNRLLTKAHIHRTIIARPQAGWRSTLIGRSPGRGGVACRNEDCTFLRHAPSSSRKRNGSQHQAYIPAQT